MPSRKRSLREAESAPSEPEQRNEHSLIQKLRNSFYFANLYQWICIFGKVVKVDDNLDIAVRFWRKYGSRQPCKFMLTCTFPQDLETECLKHGSMALQEIGLSLLKHISSHRGLSYVPQSIDSHRINGSHQIDTRYLTNTLEGNSLPSFRTKGTLLERQKSQQDSPTSISWRKLVSILHYPTTKQHLTACFIIASSAMAHDSDGHDETRTHTTKYGRAKE